MPPKMSVVAAAGELGGDPGRIVLAGWSLGANAAADVAEHPDIVGGWHPSGVGTTAPVSPALAISGFAGTVLLGAMGLAQKALIFACLPFG